MTPVGHILTGSTMFVLFSRQRLSARLKVPLLSAFIVCACIPDLQIPYWGHHKYLISHSIFVNLAIISLVCLLLLFADRVRDKIGGWKTITGCSLAWLSHLVLDSLYNHAKGVAIFWPVSDARLKLPLPWFTTLESSPAPLNWHTVRVCAVELMVYVPILLLAICAKRIVQAGRCHLDSRRAGKGP